MIAATAPSLEERVRIEDLYSEYVACLDERRYESYCHLFAGDVD